MNLRTPPVPGDRKHEIIQVRRFLPSVSDQCEASTRRSGDFPERAGRRMPLAGKIPLERGRVRSDVHAMLDLYCCHFEIVHRQADCHLVKYSLVKRPVKLGGSMGSKAKFLTVPQTAEKMGKSERAIWQRVYRGQIPHIRWGKSVLIPETELEKFLAALPGMTAEEAVQKVERGRL